MFLRKKDSFILFLKLCIYLFIYLFLWFVDSLESWVKSEVCDPQALSAVQPHLSCLVLLRLAYFKSFKLHETAPNTSDQAYLFYSTVG